MQNNPLLTIFLIGSGVFLGGVSLKRLIWNNNSLLNTEHSKRKHRQANSEYDSLVNSKVPDLDNRTPFNLKDNMVNPRYFQNEKH